MRPRGGFGVILHAEDGVAAVAHSFQGAVIEVRVRRFHFGRQRFGADREAVILGGDFHLPGLLIENRLVGRAMAEP